MRKLKIIHVALLSVFINLFGAFQLCKAQDKLVTILDEEVKREMQVLKSQEVSAYYISYRVDELTGYSISSSFGALTYSGERKKILYLTVTVRVGSAQFDNFHQVRDNSYDYMSYSNVAIPSIEEPIAVKQAIWNATNEAYQQAVAKYSKAKANVAVKADEEDKSDDFSMEEPNVSMEAPLKSDDFKFSISEWEKRLNKYSVIFLKDSAIFRGSSNFSLQFGRKYFVSSNGDKIAQNSAIVSVGLSGTIKAKDGMELPLNEIYYASKPDKLPSDASMAKDAEQVVKNLIALKNAPIAEPFSGPALLTGKASGVFFHEIFGHRVEGQRMKKENDAQTFKKKVNELVLPDFFNVYCDPLKKSYNGYELNGYYIFDDQGTKAQRVNIVEKGILKNFLMSRSPINGFPESNGHGRAQLGLQPVSRQSNLIVETLQPKSYEELKIELVKLVKEQNKPYGYLFDEVVGGFTQTGRFVPNAFNVTPTLVYRVYADGRPDEIVRGVDLVGTPLAIFSQIDMAGGNTEIFNGYCGAESGSVPVSCVSPMLLVKLIETQKKEKSQERPIILPRPDSK